MTWSACRTREARFVGKEAGLGSASTQFPVRRLCSPQLGKDERRDQRLLQRLRNTIQSAQLSQVGCTKSLSQREHKLKGVKRAFMRMNHVKVL